MERVIAGLLLPPKGKEEKTLFWPDSAKSAENFYVQAPICFILFEIYITFELHRFNFVGLLTCRPKK